MFTVKFKSADPFYSKEKSGAKNNIARVCDQGMRFELLNQFVSMEEDGFIEITNPYTKNKFIRKIKNVSIYQDLFIITWEV